MSNTIESIIYERTPEQEVLYQQVEEEIRGNEQTNGQYMLSMLEPLGKLTPAERNQYFRSGFWPRLPDGTVSQTHMSLSSMLRWYFRQPDDKRPAWKTVRQLRKAYLAAGKLRKSKKLLNEGIETLRSSMDRDDVKANKPLLAECAKTLDSAEAAESQKQVDQAWVKVTDRLKTINDLPKAKQEEGVPHRSLVELPKYMSEFAIMQLVINELHEATSGRADADIASYLRETSKSLKEWAREAQKKHELPF